MLTYSDIVFAIMYADRHPLAETVLASWVAMSSDIVGVANV